MSVIRPVNTMANRLVFKRHAGSQMDSPRERTATGKQWHISAQAEANNANHARAIAQMQHELGKLRRRIPGGSGTGRSTGMVWKGQYNGGAYKAQSVVVFAPDGQSAGAYVAIKNVPAGQAPDIGPQYWDAWPTPSPGQFI